MNKRTISTIGGIVAITGVFAAVIFLNPEQGLNNEGATDPVPPVTQAEIKAMVDEWMNNPDDDDRGHRLEIMKAFYTFEESGQWFSDDQEGRVLYNQIVKMVSFDIPKTELDQIKQEIREELVEKGFQIEP